MAEKAEYDKVAAAILKLLIADEKAMVPAMFQSMIPVDAAPKLARHCAQVAVDTCEAWHKGNGAST